MSHIRYQFLVTFDGDLVNESDYWSAEPHVNPGMVLTEIKDQLHIVWPAHNSIVRELPPQGQTYIPVNHPSRKGVTR